MLRSLIKQSFSGAKDVTNKDPVHLKNEANSHQDNITKNFQKPEFNQYVANFQKSFYDKQYLERS